MWRYSIFRGGGRSETGVSVENVLTIELVSFLYYSRTRYRDSSLAFRNYGVNLFNFVFFFRELMNLTMKNFSRVNENAWQVWVEIEKIKNDIYVYIFRIGFLLWRETFVSMVGIKKKRKVGFIYIWLLKVVWWVRKTRWN